MVTDEKQLTLIRQLKSGGTVEFDSVQFAKSRIVETKMNLSWKTQADVSDQMMHQAAFARDWGFGEVRWGCGTPRVLSWQKSLEKPAVDTP